MKQFIGILWVMLLGIACRGDRMKAFAPGTYVRFVESGAEKAWDTLRIAPLGGNHYRVERSIGYQSTLDGRLLEKKYRHSRWPSELDTDRGELADRAFGHALRLLPDSSGLEMGGLYFVKIN